MDGGLVVDWCLLVLRVLFLLLSCDVLLTLVQAHVWLFRMWPWVTIDVYLMYVRLLWLPCNIIVWGTLILIWYLLVCSSDGGVDKCTAAWRMQDGISTNNLSSQLGGNSVLCHTNKISQHMCTHAPARKCQGGGEGGFGME